MTEENECPAVNPFGDDPTRYKRMLDLLRDARANHAWTSTVPTGELSCWTLGRTVLMVQRIGDSVEVYTNSMTPSTWVEIEDWLETL